MNISETTSIYGGIFVTHEGASVQVMTLNASVDTANNNLSMTASTQNKELAIQYAADVKAQYDQFYALIQTRCIALGFPIFTVPTP
jgi:hypothetical protein